MWVVPRLVKKQRCFHNQETQAKCCEALLRTVSVVYIGYNTVLVKTEADSNITECPHDDKRSTVGMIRGGGGF